MAGSTSQSSSNESYVDPVQQQYNSDLYSQARSLQRRQGDIGSIAQRNLEPLYDDAYSAYKNNILDFNVSKDVANGDNLGMQTLANMQNGEDNPYLDSYYNAALTGVNNNLQRNILPSIRSGAVGAGQSGSSRHGIAEGLALSDANQQASDLAAQIYGGAYDADAGRRLASAQGYISSGLEGEGQQATQASNIIGTAGNLYSMLMDPYDRAWDPLRNYKSIVGNPAILGEGSSSGSGWNIL